MLRFREAVLFAGVSLALSQLPDIASAQGKGNGKGQGGGKDKAPSGQSVAKGKGGGQGEGKGKGQAKVKEDAPGRGKNDAAGSRGRSGSARNDADKNDRSNGSAASSSRGNSGKSKFYRVATPGSMPQSLRRYATSGNARDVILAAAVSHAFARGRGDDFRIDSQGNRMRVANRNGDELVYLDDDDARNLGRWRVGMVGDDIREGAPSFCRSGEGHPVWGRQWCLDKGFGLGGYDDYRWGRTNDIDNIVFAPASIGGSLVGSVLEGILGRTAYNRLALHAVTLGLVDPLAGRWVSQQTGPQLLMVNSGQYPVAEIVDVNRDNRADDLLVALRSW